MLELTLPTTTVYKPRALAVIKNKFRFEDRLVFLGDGTAAIYAGNIFVRKVAYLQPNPRLMYATNERVPAEVKPYLI